MAAIFVAWAVVFTVHGTIWLAVAVLAAIALVAAVAGRKRGRKLVLRPRGHGTALTLGVVLGMLLWHVAGVVSGDGLFHLHRVLMLTDLGDLHLRSVDEFKDGGLHPGYAFPLWHGFLALVSKLSGVAPSLVVQHESSLLVPIACAVGWEAGVAVFGSSGSGFAVVAGQLALYCFAAGHGGSYASLDLPATAARQLLVPVAIALFFGYAASRRWPLAAALAAAFGSLALIHVTYALFALIPLGAYALVRLGEWRASAVALLAAIVPTLLVVLWLKPIVDETLSHDPNGTALRNGLAQYASELRVWSPHRYSLAPEVVGRTGAVAVLALVLVPVAGFAIRRRWGVFVLSGTVSVLALMLVPTLFTHFSDAVSLSQSRRAAGFVPFTFAFAGGLLLVARSVVAIPAALIAGIVLQSLWPGDFGYGLEHGGPALATWIALVGGAAALLVGLVLRRPGLRERPGVAAFAACAFVLPVALHGFSHWSALVKSDPDALPPQIAQELRAVPPRSIVIAPVQMSYRLVAAAPVYVVAAPISHVANTKANRALPAGEGRRALAGDRRPGDSTQIWGNLGGERRAPLPSQAMKVLIVTMYFPPSGGGGVQRTLKFATHLPALGIETHVLAPDDPRWIHRDDDLAPPSQAWVHRARYIGPSGRKPAEELHGTTGLERIGRQASLFGRRLLVPDENVSWNLTAIPAAVQIVRREGIDVVLTTSPPSSVHLIGAAVKRATGVKWVADLRDSMVAHPHRAAERLIVRAKEQGEQLTARLVANKADAIIAVSEAIAAEMRERTPHGVVSHISNGSDFDDFAGLEYHRGEQFRITHAGSFFGKRDPRPFLTALAQTDDVVARFVGDFRSSDREWAETLGLGDRLELLTYVPRRRSLELQRDSEALLLLIPDAAGRGRGVLSGKVFEYLAAERPILAVVPPDGAAAALLRETGAGVVVAPDDVDGMVRELTALRDRWRRGELAEPPLSDEWRRKLSRRTRVEELATLLERLA